MSRLQNICFESQWLTEFVDETPFQLVEVVVWIASVDGTANKEQMEERMDSAKYQNLDSAVLEPVELLKRGWLRQQDNDPKLASKSNMNMS